MEKDLKELKKSPSYPLNIMFIALLVVAFLMVKVVPTFKDVFDSFGAKLPWPTSVVISVSDFLKGNPWAVVLTIPLYFGLKALIDKGLLKEWKLTAGVGLILGLVVAFIIFAMFLPMFELDKVVK